MKKYIFFATLCMSLSFFSSDRNTLMPYITAAISTACVVKLWSQLTNYNDSPDSLGPTVCVLVAIKTCIANNDLSQGQTDAAISQLKTVFGFSSLLLAMNQLDYLRHRRLHPTYPDPVAYDSHLARSIQRSATTSNLTRQEWIAQANKIACTIINPDCNPCLQNSFNTWCQRILAADNPKNKAHVVQTVAVPVNGVPCETPQEILERLQSQHLPLIRK